MPRPGRGNYGQTSPPEGPNGLSCEFGPDDDRATWHDTIVSDQGERYDRLATGYARCWAPVLTPAVTELLDVAEPMLSGAERILDVGTGTGQLALRAIARWPSVSIVGVDASAAMREMADADADARLASPDRGRFRTVTAFADRLPFDDGSFDAVFSSFVFQLVPNRARALDEARRILRPGGLLAYVSWLHDGGRFRPDEIFDDVLAEAGLGARDSDEPSNDGRAGDLPSVRRAVNELRRAGFSQAEARPGRLDHQFTVDRYVEFLTDFDEETLFAEMEPDLREQVLVRLRSRLSRLSSADMTIRSPIVFVTGRRSKR